MQDKHKPKNSVVSNLSIPLCILTLLWLGCSMVSCSVISPSSIGRDVVGSSNKVYAVGEDEDEGGEQKTGANGTMVGSIDSKVGIVFSEVAGSKEIMPSPGEARATQLTVNATVSVENSGEYSVYVGSKSSNLVGKSTGSIIPGMVGERTYDEIEPNTWGYYAGSGDSIPEDASYKALTKGMGDVVFANHDTQIKSETRNIALGFVAKVNTDIPADVYENEITLSVVSSPRQLSFNVNTMQELTPTECAKAEIHATKQLIDTRDGKAYWVTKLKDGNCWMSQNLALDLTKDVPIEASIINEDGSMGTFAYVPEATTITDHRYGGEIDGASLAATATAYHSWDEGEHVIIYPGSVLNNFWPVFRQSQTIEGKILNGIEAFANKAALIEQNAPEDSLALTEYGLIIDVASSDWKASDIPNFTNIETPTKQLGWAVDVENKIYDAHYLIGNYYQFTTTLAMTYDQLQFYNGNDQDRAKVPTSLCPKNWRLPIASNSNIINNNEISGSFYYMLNKYGLANSIDNGQYQIALSPLFFGRTGDIRPAESLVDGTITGIGAGARAWTGTMSQGMKLYYLAVTGTMYPSWVGASSYIFAYPIRCLVLAE